MSEPGGKSHGDRREIAHQLFGDPLPRPPAEDPRPPAANLEDRVPQIWDRMLTTPYEFNAMAVGLRTFGFWHGGNVPERGDVVVYVEYVFTRKPSEFGPIVAFALGDVAGVGWANGAPAKHVASLLPLPGITRVPTYGPPPWGFACDVCGWWPPAEGGCWRFRDQSQALMAAVQAGMSVTLAGLVCTSCLAGAGDVRRAQIGYERGGL